MESLGVVAWILELSKGHPVIAGALSLWGLSVLTYLTKYIPRVFNWLENQLTVKVEINNAGYGNAMDNYSKLMSWISTKHKSGTRSLQVFHNNTNDLEPISFGIGFGCVFFIWYEKRLYWISKSKLESSGSHIEKESTIIHGFGRNSSKLKNMIFKALSDVSNDSKYINIWDNQYDGWSTISLIKNRSFDSVILNKTLKDTMVDNLDHFYNSEKWFESRNLPYKQTNILYGVPGTGKTSTIKAMASHYKKNIYQLSLHHLTKSSLLKAISTIKNGDFLVFEDFESNMVKDRSTNNSEEQTFDGKEEHLTLSDILNIFDGIVPLNDIVIFLTTNHIETIDPAFLRKGRVDNMYELKALTDTEIKQYIHFMFNKDIDLTSYTFPDKCGCDLHAMFLESRDDYKTFIEGLLK